MKSILAIFLVMLMVPPASGGIGIGTTGAIKNAVNKLDKKVSVSASPAIASLVANPASISTGAATTITCAASDPNGYALSYAWSAANGVISGSGAQITWTAPTSGGTYAVVVTVSNGHGGSSQSSVAVVVTVAHSLTVTLAGTGSGIVTSSLAGINCGSTCLASYASNTQVTLTATANSGSAFTGWSGEGCSGTGTCTVTMSAAQSVTATFTNNSPNNDSLTVYLAGTGSGTVTSSPIGINCGSTCLASYASGTPVTLTTTTASGSTFTGWSGGGCSGTGTCTVTMNVAQTVTATFADAQAPTLPTNLTATVASSSQINLSWTASTDNVGVTNYKVYRDAGATPIATPTGATYNDTGRTASTTYSYTVSACDAANNCSAQSASASTTTLKQPGTYSVFSDNMDAFPTGWTLNDNGVEPATQWKLWTCVTCTDGHTAFAGENHNPPNTYDRSFERDLSLAGYSSASLSFDSTFCLSGVSLRVEEFVGGAWSPILTLANECWPAATWRPRYTVAVSTTATKIRIRLLGVATDNGQAFVDNVALTGTVN